MANNYHRKNSIVGPGGVKCSCCGGVFSNKPKKYFNRLFRRKNKKVSEED